MKKLRTDSYWSGIAEMLLIPVIGTSDCSPILPETATQSEANVAHTGLVRYIKRAYPEMLEEFQLRKKLTPEIGWCFWWQRREGKENG